MTTTAQAGGSDRSPYGVCAHVARGGEHEIARREFALMKAAGIEWARSDFDWSGVEPAEGEWTFGHLDDTVAWAEEAGVTLLPILDYDVAWARPAYRNLDAWTEYVRRVVSRYKDRLRYWEVWNEQNLEGFWRETPDPANYVILLRAAYETIKGIDPDLTVLIGGFAGIPWAFIEGVYEHDGAAYFDVMNVHPYRYPKPPGSGGLYEDLVKLRELMARYETRHKPIWITEIGWPTHAPPDIVGDMLQEVVAAGMQAIAPEQRSWSAAVLDDPDYARPFTPEEAATARRMLADRPHREIGVGDVASLDPESTQLLVMPPEEGFPAAVFDAIESYVRAGGVVLFWQGVPLYYEVRRQEDGTWQRTHASESFRHRLHIGWEAWWTRDGVPKSAATVSPADGLRNTLSLPGKMPKAERFLTDSALASGDRFVPILEVTQGDYRGVCAAAYALNSDLKGGVIVVTLTAVGRNVTPERQGMICPRAYLLAQQAGVERMFWYEFQAVEWDPFYNEHHFGMVHRDLTPKPAYNAVKVLTRACPAGSTFGSDDWRTGDDLYHLHWRRPDGMTVWALWTAGTPRPATLMVEGVIRDAFDHLGRPVNVVLEAGTAQVQLSESILYVVGPARVTPALAPK